MSGLWAGLKANLAAGTRLALFMPVRASNFRISAGHYAMLVGASFVAWLAGGMLRGGFPGAIDAGALVTGLGQLPLMLLACLLAATLLRDAALTLALAVLITATDPVFEGVAVVLATAARLESVAPYFRGAPAARVVHDLAVRGAEAVAREYEQRDAAIERLVAFSTERSDLIDWDVLERIDELAWSD